jgi:hypothetical protein
MCSVRRTLFEETPLLGAGRNNHPFIHSFIHSSSNQASNHSKAKHSTAQHSTAQHNTAGMGQSAGQLHSLHSPGCPRRRLPATGPLHRHLQTADAESGRSFLEFPSERPSLKHVPQVSVSDRHCFSDIHIQRDQLDLERSPLDGPGGRIRDFLQAF